MWITRFGHIWFPMESQPKSKCKCNIYCVKALSHTWLIVVGIFWYNRRSEFLIRNDYSYNDDYPCVFVINKDYSYNDKARDHLKDEI